jgi:hypothetical protein
MAAAGRFRIDQEWWNKHRPILLATILPVLAAIGAFVALTTMRPTQNISQRPSMALFSACLDANNLDQIGGYTSQFDAEEASQLAIKLCGSKLPPSARDGQQTDPGVVAFNQCMKNLGGHRRGRFGGSYRSTYATCRNLLQTNAPDTGSSTATTHSVAPIA